MIVKMYKFLIYGLREEMDRFFELAQRAGFIEFIGPVKRSVELPENIQTVLSAIKVCKTHEIHAQALPPVPEDPVVFAHRILELQGMFEQFLEEQRLLKAEIARIAPFGDFSKEDFIHAQKEGKREIQFFCMKTDIAREREVPPEVIYISTDYDLDYFVAINKDRKQYPDMIEILVDRPVGELHKRLMEVDERIAALESDIRHYSNGLPFLQSGLIDLLNEYHLKMAKQDISMPIESHLFAVEAWVPKSRIKALHALLSQFTVSAEEISIEEVDRIPTCMENKGYGKIGEDVINAYDAPSHNDKDPSSWVLTFFTLFFAMIISDAGYGLVYLLLGLYLNFKFPKIVGAGKRMIRLVLLLASACIVWGIMTASFFGMEIGPDNPFRKTSFLHALAKQKASYHMEMKDDVYDEYVRQFPQVASATDGHDFLVKASKIVDGKTNYIALNNFYDNILMELSLVVGIVHLSLSFLRYLLRKWAGLGWVIFMIGGYLFFPKILNATTIANFTGLISKPTAYAWGEQMVYCGLGAAFIGAFLQTKWMAFHEITNVIAIFADVVSYLRLYALALASIIIAGTANSIGMEAGLFAGLLIILVGHATNICLSVMGGVIHGLRLNFLEWYHYSFEGDGRLFNPLRLRKKL